MHHTLRADHITVSRGGTRVLDGVGFPVAHGETVGVVGPNGSGKSTLVGALYGAFPLEEGTVEYGGTPLSELARRDVARTVAVVAQADEEGLPLPVRSAVALGRLPFRTNLVAPETPTDTEKIEAALRATNLTGKIDRLTTQLSGGEKQRVAIARALAQDTDFMLLDEPTNHLDLKNQLDLLELISSTGKTIVLVLHDLNLAARYCDRILVLNHGTSIACGAPVDVLTPDLIRDVFGVRATPIDVEGIRQFVFWPQTSD
ncbi:ABC transporter ATP-binding protein [Corynebacterium pyruviciproducens]|uniref:ABC transporter ATP-binding protein n=1 Tax=Corynebacterium pyruviciproducens TaxID=598660 RepID=A0AAF1BX47_9CORY|nr:ABC transporter ATP-binding protein [Corynebacterium pyruviciproducens]MDH4659324.1 ABC transporter ATP-binding protein [Corynebacterium pyruviciproducens]MDK6567238.1 ABC transporter ATP-binding protein [Corynebacterium pyruviciproducens]MDK7215391.1 ABC transporter ATP-binding protein [Corynebacterium pyruviciproducens]WOT02526.1 ABC transporter ATP-binding protein [Corynebacterium pyruviciproducens]